MLPEFLILPIYGLLGYVIFIWISLVIWQARDSFFRFKNMVYPVVLLIVTSIFTPFIGIPIYLIFRPLHPKS